MYMPIPDNCEWIHTKLGCIVTNVFPKTMQSLLIAHIPGIALRNKYKQNDIKIIGLTNGESLLMDELPNVDNFTIELCYKILRSEKLIMEPEGKWGENPEDRNISIEDDIQRIILATNVVIRKPTTEFTIDFCTRFLYKIEIVLRRIDAFLKAEICQNCYKEVCSKEIDVVAGMKEMKNCKFIEVKTTEDYMKAEERERFSRLAILITEMIPQVLRTILNYHCKLSATDMYKKYLQNSTTKFHPTEQEMIAKIPSTTTFQSLDISTICKLIRVFIDVACLHHFSLTGKPAQGWNTLPNTADLNILDDIVRIRFMRNEILHRPNTDLDKVSFENYFGSFKAISYRIDSYFHQVGENHGFEKKVTEAKTCFLDFSTKQKLDRAMNSIENMHERFTCDPITFHWNKSFEESLKEIRKLMATEKNKGKEVASLHIIIENIEDAEKKAQILHELKDEFKTMYTKVNWVKAGCIIICLEVMYSALETDDKLMSELSSLVRKIIQVERSGISRLDELHASVILIEDYEEPLISKASNGMEIMDSKKKDGNCSTTLHIELETQMSTFETDGRLQTELGGIVSRMLQTSNGSGETRHSPMSLLPIPSEDTIHANTIVPCCSLTGHEHITSDRESVMDKSCTQTSPRLGTEHINPVADMALSTLAKEQENFLRYAILIVDHTKEALQDLIELNLKNKHLTFEEFLNNNKHEIYHLCYDFRCCQCLKPPTKRKRIIIPPQLELLFDKHNKLPCHKATNCSDFCCSKSKVGITTDVLNLSLARCLLVNCCLDVFWFTCLTAQGQTLEQFLNSNKHIIYHLWKNNQNCCQCPSGFIFPRDVSIITENEWRDMFNSVLLPCFEDMKRISTGTTSVCSVAARPGIDVKDIHPEIQGLILKWCCSVRDSVEKLVTFRHLNFGHVTNAKLSDANFKEFSKETEEYILHIASYCEKVQIVKDALTNLHSRPIDARLCSHYQNILLENINKNEAISENINLQHRTTRQSIPKLVDKSSKIRRIDERVDALETSAATITEEVKDLKKNIQLPWLVDGKGFQSMLSHGEYLSYEHRLSLGGPCKAGKSTLASVLIDEQIPLQWNSTDGLVIYFGRNGIDIENEKMIPLQEGERGHEVLAKILRGKPKVFKDSDQIIYTGQETLNSVRRKSREVHTILTSESPKHFLQDGNETTKHSTDQFATKTYVSMAKSEMEHLYTQMSTKDMSTATIKTLECTKMQLQSDILREVRDGQYKIKIAPSDIIDFGGQKSYDMTHQLFIQHRGSFLLMFDGRTGLHKQLDDYPEGVTAACILRHWVDSVLTYTEDTEDIMPMILFAATHRDQCKGDIAKMRESFVQDIKCMLSNHEKRHHIHLDTVFFIKGIDKNDPEIRHLTDKIVLFAMQQSSWGQRRPMQWVPLELQISNLIMKNINIISMEDIQNINKLNDDLALTEDQLNDFLLVQHSLGKLIYYKLPGLDKCIIIHPPALVNILRSFVTDEKFFPADQNLKSILQTLIHTGKISRTDLFKLWQQDHIHQYLKDDFIKEFVIQLLVHLDILILPKSFQQSSTNVYIVPCMIKTIRPDFKKLHHKERTICLKYSLTTNSIPSALAYKVIGAAIINWPLKQENNKPCIYHKAAILNVSEDDELLIWLEDNRVMVNLTNKRSLLFISPDVAASIQECLTKNIESSLLFYFNSFGKKTKSTKVLELYTLAFGVPCGNGVCFKSAEEVKELNYWTCDRDKNHNTKYLLYWCFDKSQTMCALGCKGLSNDELKTKPSDKHLVRLGSQIGIKSFQDFYIHLGMTTMQWENTADMYSAHSREGIMSLALVKWKKSKSLDNKDPSLKDISDALKKVNVDSHVICQVFREETKLHDIADFNLQKIPSDGVLKALANQVGNYALQLGIELGVSFSEIENSLYKFPKDLPGLIEDILKKWKENSKIKTFQSLILALERVKGGGVKFLLNFTKEQGMSSMRNQ